MKNFSYKNREFATTRSSLKKLLHDRFYKKDLIRSELQGKIKSIKNSNVLISINNMINGNKTIMSTLWS